MQSNMFDDAFDEYRLSRRELLSRTIRYTLAIMTCDVHDVSLSEDARTKRTKMHYAIVEKMKREFASLT